MIIGFFGNDVDAERWRCPGWEVDPVLVMITFAYLLRLKNQNLTLSFGYTTHWCAADWTASQSGNSLSGKAKIANELGYSF